MDPVAFTERAAARLLRRMGEVPGEAGDRGRGAGAPWSGLVRCTSATAAGGSGVDAQCYPGVMVLPTAPVVVASQVDGRAVWLTLIEGAAATVPVAGVVYPCMLAGVLGVGGDVRPRAFSARTPYPFLAKVTSQVTAATDPLFLLVAGQRIGWEWHGDLSSTGAATPMGVTGLAIVPWVLNTEVSVNDFVMIYHDLNGGILLALPYVQNAMTDPDDGIAGGTYP